MISPGSWRRHCLRLPKWHKLDLCKFAIAATLITIIIQYFIAASGTMDWTITLDSPLMQYIAQCIRHGAAPYRDTFDMNMPMVYLIHIFEQITLGESDLGFRVFDLCWTALTCLAIALFLRPEGIVTQISGACIFACYHLSAGNGNMGQRDFLMGPFILFTAYFMRRFTETHKLTDIFACGAMIGTAIFVKPTIGCLLLCMGIYLPVLIPFRKLPRYVVAYGMGAALVPTLCLAWLAIIGSLSDFYHLITDFLIPIYGQVVRVPFESTLEFLIYYGSYFLPLALIPYKQKSNNSVVDIASLGLIAGALHGILQHKGWPYHIYPFITFLSVLAGIKVGDVYKSPRGLKKFIHTFLCLAGLYIFSAGYFLTPRWLGVWNIDHVIGLAVDMSPHLEPGDKVQVLDTTWGAINAIYRLDVRQATPMIYDFPFYLMPDHPYTIALRTKFMAAMVSNPPKLIVLTALQFPEYGEGFARISHFLEFQNWVNKNYSPVSETATYIIFKRVDP